MNSLPRIDPGCAVATAGAGVGAGAATAARGVPAVKLDEVVGTRETPAPANFAENSGAAGGAKARRAGATDDGCEGTACAVAGATTGGTLPI